MSLKDLTWEHHKNAERQEFVKIMMSGKNQIHVPKIKNFRTIATLSSSPE